MGNNRSVIDYLQTVVFSYLTHEQKLLLGPYFHDAINKHKHEIIEQAKAMEKEKHQKFNKFLNDEKELGISDLKTIERIQWYYNTYFNETYGK